MALGAVGTTRRLSTSGAPLAAAAAVLGAFVLVAVVDPNEPGHSPTCPFLALTGLYCPGCGSLRAAHALGHGDIAGAAGNNLLFVLAMPVAAALWARWLYGRATSRPDPLVLHRTRTWMVGIAVMVVFGVVRNLPWGGFLAP